MRLQQIHVFPVKSMAGQQVSAWPVTPQRLAGDRLWALHDAAGKIGSGKDSRRFRRVDALFSWRAKLPDPQATAWVRRGAADWREVTDPEVAAALRADCGADVRLLPENDQSHLDAAPVSLVGTATLAELGRRLGTGEPVDPRHLRANLVIETDEPYVEDGWVDRRLTIGRAHFAVTQRVTRCRMVDLEQADIPALPGLLRATGARDACAAIYLRPLAPAELTVGDLLVT